MASLRRLLMDEYESRNIPDGFQESLKQFDVNGKYQIYEGSFGIKVGIHMIEFVGNISFHWKPKASIEFRGKPKKHSKKTDSYLFGNIEGITLYINNCEVGTGYFQDKNTRPVSYFGWINVHNVILGDTDLLVDKVSFYLPNMESLRGDCVKLVTDGNPKLTNRITLDNDDYVIVLEQNYFHSRSKTQLENLGGFVLQYYGEIRKKHGTMSYLEISELRNCLNHFLSFVNGRETALCFLQAYADEELKWANFSDPLVDEYKYVVSWHSDKIMVDFNKLWIKFFQLWFAGHNGQLQDIIQWYTASNYNKIRIEGSLVLIQAAMELLYNWIFIGDHSPDDRLDADKKIRKLLTHASINLVIPKHLRFLKKMSKLELRDHNNVAFRINDGAKAITEIRNSLIHGNRTRRQNLNKIFVDARIDTWILANWYLELLILHILDYDGSYNNRTISIRQSLPFIDQVPWSLSKNEV